MGGAPQRAAAAQAAPLVARRQHQAAVAGLERLTAAPLRGQREAQAVEGRGRRGQRRGLPPARLGALRPAREVVHEGQVAQRRGRSGVGLQEVQVLAPGLGPALRPVLGPGQAEVEQGAGQVLPGGGEVGVEPQRLPELGLGLLAPPGGE
jgi:hypothetical protein